MKHIKKIIFILLMMLPISVNAHELKCDTGAYKYGDTFYCYVTMEPNTYDTIKGTIVTDEAVTCNVKEKDPNLAGTGSGQEFAMSGTTIKDKTILTIGCSITGKVESGTQSQVMINNFTTHVKDTLYDQTQEVLRSDYFSLIPMVEEEPDEPAGDGKPRDISNPYSTAKAISDPQLEYNFSRIETEYELEVLYEVSQLNLVVYPYDPNGTYRIEGNQTLQVGENIIDVYVTSGDGTSTTCYTLTIKRLARGETIYYPKSDSTLSNLTITGQDIKFEPQILEYTVHIGYNVDKLNIAETTSVVTATSTINGNEKLKNGDKVTITVVSEDKTSETTYIIHVRKASPPKDYKDEITMIVVVLVVILLVVIFIYTNQRNKNDELLRLRHDKRSVKKGNKFNANDVEEIDNNGDLNKVVAAEKPQNVVINESNVVAPTQTPELVDTNLNKVTPVQASVELSASVQAAPIQVTEPVQVETNSNISGLGDSAPILDLTNTNVADAVVQQAVPQQVVTAVPAQPVIAQPQVVEQVVAPVEPQVSAFNMAPTQVVEPVQVAEPQMFVPTQEVSPYIPETPVVEQTPIAENLDPVITESQTSVIPVTPTEYKLPQDQELQATQQINVVQELPQIEMVTPPSDLNNQ